MTPKEAAKKLDGCEYGNEGSEELWQQMKAAGLVAAFGASDDLLEFRGAIYDELGAYDGTTAYLDKQGLIVPKCDSEQCPYDRERLRHAKKGASQVVAHWSPKSPDCSWLITGTMPHETFKVYEDEELYCVGIVFRLEDCACST